MFPQIHDLVTYWLGVAFVFGISFLYASEILSWFLVRIDSEILSLGVLEAESAGGLRIKLFFLEEGPKIFRWLGILVLAGQFLLQTAYGQAVIVFIYEDHKSF